MFNEQPFNRGKFNISKDESNSFFGEININVDCNSNFSAIKLFEGLTEIQTNTTSELIKTTSIKNISIINISVKNEIKPIIIRNFAGESTINIFAYSDSFNSFGYERIKLTGLTLKPGDELVIDTREMTIYMNGQNVIEYFTNDSDFFDIKPSENIIIYENGVTDSKSDIKILWKDLFL